MTGVYQARMREVSKNTLDFIRNYAIVLSIGTLAKLSDEKWIEFCFFFATAALAVNVLSYIPVLTIRDFFEEHPRLNMTWARILTFLLLSGPLIVFAYIYTNSISLIIERQIKEAITSKNAPRAPPPCRFTLDLTGYRCAQS